VNPALIAILVLIVLMATLVAIVRRNASEPLFAPKRIGVMRQESSGLEVEVHDGWSWPCFWLGAFWYLSKGMWGIALVWIALSIVSWSTLWFVGMLFMPAIANRQLRDHLGARGYRLVTEQAPPLVTTP
jgi:hypothetical protein